MPPVMGAAAFVMAEFLAVPYAQVALWALIPAILYYVAVFFAVHFEAKRYGLAGVPKSELPRFGHVMARARPPVRPDPGRARRPDPRLLRAAAARWSARCRACRSRCCARRRARASRWRTVLDALVDGARNTLAVAMACACAGIVIGCVTITGLGIMFTQIVIALSQNSLLLALRAHGDRGHHPRHGHADDAGVHRHGVAAGAGASIKLGAIPPAAHMFAFYFAILSAITPPVALAVFAAAALAKADMWRPAGGGAPRRAGVHRAVHVRLRAVAADDRRLVHERRRRTRRSAPVSRRRPDGLPAPRSAGGSARCVAALLIKPGYITDASVALLRRSRRSRWRCARE